MIRLLLTWVVNAVALIALPYVFSGIHVADFKTAMIAALVLGLINTLIRPILVLLTLPATILTLDLGFRVDGFWTAVLGAVVYSVISWVLSALLPGRK